MQVSSILQGEALTRLLQGAAAGAVATLFVGFIVAAEPMFIFASAAMAQDATARLSPLFLVRPQIAQEIGREYAPYSVRPSMVWRAPVFPHTWDVQAVVPFTLEETSAPEPTSKPD
jgi:hypothetical protein